MITNNKWTLKDLKKSSKQVISQRLKTNQEAQVMKAGIPYILQFPCLARLPWRGTAQQKTNEHSKCSKYYTQMAPPRRYQSTDFKRSLCHNPLFFVKCCQTFIISQWSFFFRCEWSYKPVTWMTGHACRTWNPQEGRGGRVWQATNLLALWRVGHNARLSHIGFSR